MLSMARQAMGLLDMVRRVTVRDRVTVRQVMVRDRAMVPARQTVGHCVALPRAPRAVH